MYDILGNEKRYTSQATQSKRESIVNDMASFLDESKSDIPVLRRKHSGIPEYLLDKARDAKKSIFDTRMKPLNERSRLPAIPLGIGRDEFFQALDELRQELGAENVEINDKPLKDGW